MDHAPPHSHEIMDRLIEVTVDLHLERGDREVLTAERQRLFQLAKELNLIPAKETPPISP
jgi:hypothetical protein